MADRDPYTVLGVDREASSDEIRSAYRRLARQYHPDLNPGDTEAEEKFKEASSAYAVLSDPEKRARFDQYGTAEEQPFTNPGDFLRDFGFGDIFEAFFGQATAGRRDPANQPGEDEEVSLQVSLDEVLTGVEKEIQYRRMARCGTCGGNGARPGTAPAACPACGGAGMVTRAVQTPLGSMRTSGVCPKCRGAGKIVADPCPDCKGRGLRVESAKVAVQIPAGVESGNTLRVGGKGSDGLGSGRPGDLYVALTVADDPRFRRDGTALLTRLDITFAQAALGDEAEVESLEGTVGFELPPGTQHGHRFRLKGHGLPRPGRAAT
jgi:molecular chaperone DnaJ